MLEVRDLYKVYGKFVALNGASFSVPRGVCYGLLGPNGAGKTTAISIVAGTLESDAGEALLDGEPIGIGNLQLKRRIGYVPQDLALYEDLSAQDNLKFFGALYGLSGRDLADRMAFAFDVSGLNERRKHPVRSFSGGMKRRLNIAAALLHDPDLLILDEPTVGVDPQSRNLIFEALQALVDRGKTLLYTTHYMEEVERLCEKVAIMDHGRVIAEGDIGELHRLLPAQRVVHVELEAPLDEELCDIPGVLSSTQERPIVTLELDDLTRDLPMALNEISARGGIIDHVRTQRPSLEQVFLHLTGRRLRD
jgi:ABC-2 type transport system ATP-binding protein